MSSASQPTNRRRAFILAPVERHVKERLVGAAVLVAAAIILVPEMLSGPKRANDAVAVRNDAPVKTYTIDLNRSPGAPATAPIAQSAPPPESAPPAAVADEAQGTSAPAEPAAENPPQTTQASPESVHAESAPIAQQPAPQPPATALVQEPTAPRQREPAPAPTVASAPNGPTSRGWAVQLGSFANRGTAERLAKDFSGSGYEAFVMPVKSGTNTLYRVRVGPFADRAGANDALSSIKKRVAGAAVVAHP